ncbi:MAG: NAD(P)-dependent oxidoreductase [Verrucomicrobia bacterium]|nr:NAD(P)-dependent oxidoreductase [Verrucomicrobiota bacterium]
MKSLSADLEHVLSRGGRQWESLRGKTVFVTGASGFFGQWLLHSYFAISDELGLQGKLIALTREAAAFRKRLGALSNRRDLRVVEGRCSDFAFPEQSADLLIHAAIEYAPPWRLFEEAFLGTRRILEYARQSRCERLLYLSSGAAYGPQPPELSAMAETWSGAPSTVLAESAYGEAKRAGELMCAAVRAEGGPDYTIARCFAFLGPFQRLDVPAAITSFISDALAHRPIRIAGDGTPLRTYLYAADLTIWLWRMLLEGRSGALYNVGGATPVSIRELAECVAQAVRPGLPVEIAQKQPRPGLPARYVPDVSLARAELGLEAWVELDDAVQRTIRWHLRAPGTD